MAEKKAGRTRSVKKPRAAARKSETAKKARGKPAQKATPGPFGIRTAPKGDRYHAPEMALRKYALGMPQATED